MRQERKLPESMLFPNAMDRYPNLTRFLDEWKNKTAQESIPFVIAAIVVVAFSIGLAVVGSPIVWLAATLFAGVIGFQIYTRQKREREPGYETHKRASGVIHGFHTLKSKNRLHRDFSEATLTVLDEAIRLRNEIVLVIRSSGWDSASLPENYRAVRDKALAASEQSVLEAFLAFQTVLPERIADRGAMDYVNEFAERFTGTSASALKAPEVGYETARHLCLRLQALKDELEGMTSALARVPTTPVLRTPGSSIDELLRDVEAIKIAEREIDQSRDTPSPRDYL